MDNKDQQNSVEAQQEMNSPMMNRLEISWLALPKNVSFEGPSSRSSRWTQLNSSDEKAQPKKQHMDRMYTLWVRMPSTTTLMITGTQSLNASSTRRQYLSRSLSRSPCSSSSPLPSSITCLSCPCCSCWAVSPLSMSSSSCVSLLTSTSVWWLIRDYSISSTLIFSLGSQLIVGFFSTLLGSVLWGCYDYDYEISSLPSVDFFLILGCPASDSSSFYLFRTGVLLLFLSSRSVSRSISILFFGLRSTEFFFPGLFTGLSMKSPVRLKDSILDLFSWSFSCTCPASISFSALGWSSLWSRVSMMASLRAGSGRGLGGSSGAWSYSRVNLNSSSQNMARQSWQRVDRSQQQSRRRWMMSRGREKQRMDSQNWDTLMYSIYTCLLLDNSDIKQCHQYCHPLPHKPQAHQLGAQINLYPQVVDIKICFLNQTMVVQLMAKQAVHLLNCLLASQFTIHRGC